MALNSMNSCIPVKEDKREAGEVLRNLQSFEDLLARLNNITFKIDNKTQEVQHSNMADCRVGNHTQELRKLSDATNVPDSDIPLALKIQEFYARLAVQIELLEAIASRIDI